MCQTPAYDHKRRPRKVDQLVDRVSPPGLALVSLIMVVIGWIFFQGPHLPAQGSLGHSTLMLVTLAFTVAAIVISRNERACLEARRAFDERGEKIAEARAIAARAERILPQARAGEAARLNHRRL